MAEILRGKPVWTLLPGQYPNKLMIREIQADFPGIVHLEHRHKPCTFVVTVIQRRKA
jgi:hypothetical protein